MKTQIIHLTENPEVTLTAYLLDSSEELANAKIRPAVMILPGGAYMGCSDREAEPVAVAYLSEGYHALVLRYSIREQAVFPQPLNDAETALEYIRSRSEEWKINPEKIAVCGFSAGGHLAAALGTMGRVRPNALILGYPCILEKMGEGIKMMIPSCEKYVDEHTPPTFIFSTRDDEVVPIENAIAFTAALEKAGVPFEIHIFQNGTHGLSLAKGHTSSGLKRLVNPDVAKWFDLSISWLQNLFGGFEADQDYLIQETIHQYSIDIPFGMLWDHPECQKIVLQYFPVLGEGQDLRAAMSVSLRTMSGYAKEVFTQEKLVMLDKDLKQIPFNP